MKIFVEILTPGNGKTYEFEISDTLNVKKAKERIIKNISTFENNAIIFKEDASVLCHLDKNATLDESVTMKEAGIKSGDNLLLV
ncbi:MAG: hypothetical protein AB9921_03180 [Erysipelotrichaceae bacterium]